ncbi:hypothetical protein BDZ45DRAFT_681649 [Acephala macrosclerotiorum]|nr:hypothetical protein BDZ45DRAFT_681649 [Acephala macrosclerotiorum]
MSDWKPAEEGEYRDFLYIEEVNSNDGTSRRLTGINTTQSVQDLKKAIAAELKNPEGWSSVSLAFADKELSDLDASLSSFTIQEGDTIFFTRSVTPAVNPPPYSNQTILKTVMFQNLEGRTMTLHDIPIAWKVKQLLEKLGREKALEVDDLRLLWGGKQLEDEKTLQDYGLGKDCTIHIVSRLNGGVRDLS